MQQKITGSLGIASSRRFTWLLRVDTEKGRMLDAAVDGGSVEETLCGLVDKLKKALAEEGALTWN